MKNDETAEYITAFAIGALVGVGAALLLAPEPPTRREKLMKELKPYRKQLNKQTKRARKQLDRGRGAAADMGDELVEAGRAVVSDLRDEIADLVAGARAEIADAMEQQLDSAEKALRKRAKRIRG